MFPRNSDGPAARAFWAIMEGDLDYPVEALFEAEPGLRDQLMNEGADDGTQNVGEGPHER